VNETLHLVNNNLKATNTVMGRFQVLTISLQVFLAYRNLH